MEPNYLGAFATTVIESFQTVWTGLLELLPSIIAALVVLILGWIFASALGKFVRKAVEFTKVDEIIDKAGLDKSLSEAGIDFSLAKLLGWLFKWFVIVVILIAVAEILGLEQITTFLETIALYIPNIIIAVVILLVGMVVGNFVDKVVRKTVEASKIKTAAGFLASLAKWAIIGFTFLAALSHLKIAEDLIATLFMGLVGMLALAGGLAFGLGGKDAAKELIESAKRDIQS
jgi:small-conductance mechanosensitive channel